MFEESPTVDLTFAQQFIQSDGLQLKADHSSSLDADLKAELIKGDKEIIDLDKELRLIEMQQVRIVKHNAAHPKELIADLTTLMTLMLEHRKNFVGITNDFREKASRF